MRQPIVWQLSSLINHTRECSTFNPEHGWIPARPVGYDGFFNRIKAAWLVLRGKADAVIWPGGQ